MEQFPRFSDLFYHPIIVMLLDMNSICIIAHAHTIFSCSKGCARFMEEKRFGW
jgi:hypothetical protein